MFSSKKKKKSKRKFLLRGEKFVLPLADSDNEKDLKDALFAAIKELPTVESCPDDIETDIFNPQNALGVLEKGMIVVSPHHGKYSVAGTDNLHICLGMSFYCRRTNKLIIAHIDASPSTDELKAILDEFDPMDEVEVRVFGGLASGACDKGFVSDSSVAKAKEVFWYLYNNSQNIQLDFRTANIFEGLDEYRNKCLAEELSTNIGFAVNSTNGKVFVSPCPFLEEKLVPYQILFDNCGLFSGPYRDGHVNVAFLQHIECANKMNKHYDAFAENWEEDYENELEKMCFNGLTNVLLKMLEKIGYFDPCSSMKTGLIEFIKGNLQTWREESGYSHVPWRELLLQKCAFDEMTKKAPYEEMLKAMDFDCKNIFVNEVASSGILKKWCLSACRFYIREAIKGQLQELAEIDEEFFIKLDRYLQDIKGSVQLLKTFIRFEKSLVFYGYRGTKEEILITQLATCKVDEIPRIISEWRFSEINRGLKFYADATFKKVSKHNIEIKEYKEEFTAFLVDILDTILKRTVGFDNINLDNMDYDHPKTQELIDAIALIFLNNIKATSPLSLLCCSNSIDNLDNLFEFEKITEEITNTVAYWCKNCLTEEEELLEIDEEQLNAILHGNLSSHPPEVDDGYKGKEKKKEGESKNVKRM